ncbi:MAG: hypothetical protein ACLPSL_16465 [Smithella sp.]
MKLSHFLLSGVMVMLAATAQIQPVYGGECPPNSAPASEKDNVVHCRCISGFENKGGVCVPVTELETQNDKLQKVWRKVLNCELEDIYARLESFGQEGIKFAEELRNEVKKVYREGGKPVQGSNDRNDANIVHIDLDRTGHLINGYEEGQYIVSIGIYTHGDGDIQVDVQGSFSRLIGKNDKHYEVNEVLRIDKSGQIAAANISGAVQACLAR